MKAAVELYLVSYELEESKQHIIDKFGHKGYAVEKMYFKDIEYEKFLNDVKTLIEDNDLFIKRYKEVNNLDIK